MEVRVYEVPAADNAKLKKILEADPYAPVSFSRQGYKLKEGEGVGGEKGKYYLLIKGEADFFKWADEKLKEVASVKRVEKAAEERIAKTIEEQDSSAEMGMGAIFG